MARCDSCPFESSDPEAIRGHEAGPGSRGWLGVGEQHRMIRNAEAQPAGPEELAGDQDRIQYLEAERLTRAALARLAELAPDMTQADYAAKLHAILYPELPCTCTDPERMAETPDDAARCATCGGEIDQYAAAQLADVAERRAAYTTPELCPTCGHPLADEIDGVCPACCDAQQLGAYSPCGDPIDHQPGCPLGAGGECDCRPRLPIGATLDDDPEALADELTAAYAESIASQAARWSSILRAANGRRLNLIVAARLTRDELAAEAARLGIVADPDALPLNAQRFVKVNEARDRQREAGDVWAGIERARANGPGGASGGRVADGGTHAAARFYEDSDGFEETSRGGPVTVGGERVGMALVAAPIYAAGIADRARKVYPKAPHDPRSHSYRARHGRREPLPLDEPADVPPGLTGADMLALDPPRD